LEEHLALLHDVAFMKERLLNLTRHLRAHGDRCVCLDVADSLDVDRHILLDHLRCDDGLCAAAATAATPASASASAATAAGILGAGGAAAAADGEQRCRANSGKRELSTSL